MAYDRYDTRRGWREPPRNPDDRYREREGFDRGGRDERGFFERAGEQIASWFGDEDDEERRDRPNERMGGREDYGRDRSGFDRDEGRGFRSSRDREPWGGGDRSDRGERGGYRPVTGDYGRSEGMMAGGYGAREPDRNWGRERFERPDNNWGRDDYRRTSLAGSSERSQHDPHYHQWRQRQVEELDRDYDEYRREHQSKFEDDFGNWRSRRQTKRQMLGQIREHMEVVGSDDEHVGTVDRIAGDRIILTKSDGDDAAHHSLSCTDVERIDGERVILEVSAKQARSRWLDENRDRALFEREDRGEAGPHMLDRSFSGTYR